VEFSPRPAGVLGQSDPHRRRIFLTPGMLQVQRRTVLDHELQHAEAGDDGCQHPKREAQINRDSARRLVPFQQLLDAWLWAYSVEEMADECWVDVDTMRRRIDNLTDVEREAVRCALAARDFNEEGMP
jgi:hypothetical protein